MQKIHTFLIAAVFSAGLAAGVTAEDSGKGKMDWPQWRGPNRDGISSEKGLLKTWPEGGPKILWRAASGDGYSAMSVVEGRLYTIYGRNADELVVCLDAGSGDELWRYRLDSKFTNQYGHGPRSTPTVDGNIVYALGAQGKLVALNAVKGARVWTHDLPKEYGAKIPVWGVSTSPMVYRDLLLVDVGGRNGHGFVAFNKKDGKVVWKATTALPGYSAPIAVEVNGVAQILNFTGNSLISVDPKTGRQFWRFSWKTSYDIKAWFVIPIARIFFWFRMYRTPFESVGTVQQRPRRSWASARCRYLSGVASISTSLPRSLKRISWPSAMRNAP